jgi:hypothetical protein
MSNAITLAISLALGAASLTLAKVPVPPGAVMPTNPLGGPLPTLNPFRVERNITMPTSNVDRSALKTINVVKQDFFIGVVAIFGAIGLVVASLVVFRWMRGSASLDRSDINERFEREQVRCVLPCCFCGGVSAAAYTTAHTPHRRPCWSAPTPSSATCHNALNIPLPT